MKDSSVDQGIGSLPLDVYGDPEKILKVFGQFTVVIALGLCAGLIYELSISNLVSAMILGAGILPVLVSYYFTRRRKFETAAIFLVIVLMSLITAVATNGRGIRQISIIGFPAVLIVASLVIRKRVMVYLILYNLICAAWLIFGEIYSVYTPDPLEATTPGEFVILAFILIVTAFMVRILTERLFQNNLHLKQELFERKRIEEQREVLIHELEARNTELTQFTYTVSHDLKSPLVTIKGFLGYLEADAASGNLDRLRMDTARIASAVEKMQRLLNDLLEISRIGRLVNQPEEVPFEEIVREARKLVSEQLDDGRISFTLEPNLPHVRGDRQRLIEVLQNLLDNAVRFMGGQEHPRVEIGQRGYENDRPVFFVKDNGIGIAPEYHERVFGLFNRLNPEIEGTGTGLPLVKRIIEFHGGRIWIESEAGRGATFYFTLPQP